jgi:hypothetical protein
MSPLVSRLLLTYPVLRRYVVLAVGDAANKVGMLSQSASASCPTGGVMWTRRNSVDIVYICEERMEVRRIVGMPKQSAQMRQTCGIGT